MNRNINQDPGLRVTDNPYYGVEIDDAIPDSTSVGQNINLNYFELLTATKKCSLWNVNLFKHHWFAIEENLYSDVLRKKYELNMRIVCHVQLVPLILFDKRNSRISV